MKKLILILLIIIGNVSFGQNSDVPFIESNFPDNKEGFEKALAEIESGDAFFHKGNEADLSVSLEHYLKADEFNHYSTRLSYKIGVCYLNSTQKFKALEYLVFAKEKAPKDRQYDAIDFYLGQVYHLNGEWDRAIKYYSDYKDQVGDKDKALVFYVNKKMTECKTGEKLTNRPIRVWVDNLGAEVNSKYSDFGPVISADNKMLFFTSRREGSTGDGADNTGMSFEDIYFSSKDERDEWNKAKNIGDPVNTDSHDAAVGLSPDGKSLLVYHGVSKNTGNILITKQKEDGSWVKTEELKGDVNTKHHEIDATLSFDEKTLYFVSDRPGGFGNHDIYVTYWDEEKKEWGKAENVGATLNTEFDEKGVFFHPDNKTLYFSSQGHNTMGGLDIFKSVFDHETKVWSTPVNIGSPINTPDDDVYFVTSGDERFAYYSSYRADGFGEKDIYRVTFLGDEKEPLVASIEDVDILSEKLTSNGEFINRPLTLIKGKVTDGNTEEALVTTVFITNSKTNEKIAEIVTNEDGSYMYVVKAGDDYAFSTTLPGYTIASDVVQTKESDSGTETILDLALFPPVEGGEFVLKNIYFTFDKSYLRDESVKELDQLVKVMNENPSIEIELGGHTDAVGPDDYNYRLSTKRAEVAKKYLVSKNINPDRITTKGYGETMTIIKRSVINRMKTEREKEEAHQANRRTIVKITKQ